MTYVFFHFQKWFQHGKEEAEELNIDIHFKKWVGFGFKIYIKDGHGQQGAKARSEVRSFHVK